MNSMKKVLALVMVCLMLASLMPVSAFAEDEETLHEHSWDIEVPEPTSEEEQGEQPEEIIPEEWHYCAEDDCLLEYNGRHQVLWDAETEQFTCADYGCDLEHDHTGNWDAETGTCSVCGYECEHSDEDADYSCDTCGFDMPVPKEKHEWLDDDITKEHKCSVEGCTEHAAHGADWDTSADVSACKHTGCTVTCEHTGSFTSAGTVNHTCDNCSKKIPHTWAGSTGDCQYCGTTHLHTEWVDGHCKECNMECEHPSHTDDGKCSVCKLAGMEHEIDPETGKCSCGLACPHTKYVKDNCGYHKCNTCGFKAKHTLGTDKICTVCGDSAEHTHSKEAKCTVCGLDSPHVFKLVEGDYENHKCSIGECDAVEAHDDKGEDGVCGVCGQTKKPTEYTKYELSDGSTVELVVILGKTETVSQGSSNLGGLDTEAENVNIKLENLDVAALIKRASELGVEFDDKSEVEINITTKVQPGDVKQNANGEVECLPFTVTPSIKIIDKQSVTVTPGSNIKEKTFNGSDVNTYLTGEIEVVLPVGNLVSIEGIDHISDSGKETIDKSKLTHDAEAKTVAFTVTHFSEFDVLTKSSENAVVASCGTAVFTDLQSALDYAAKNSGTVKILADITKTGNTYTVPDSTKTIILDLNGHTIESDGTVLDVSAKNFTVSENSTSQGKINSTNGDALYLNSGATVTVTGGLLHNNSGSDAAVYVSEGAVLNVTGGKIWSVSDYAVESYGTVTVKGSNAVVVSETNSAINNNGTLTVESGNINFDGQSATGTADDIVGSGTTSVSGGNFGHAVPEKQCAADYMPNPKDTAAPFTVVPMSKVKAAKLVVSGGEPTYFDSLQEAINAVTADGTVEANKRIPTAKSVVTLLRNVAENITIDKSEIQNGFVVNADGFSIVKSDEGATADGTITVRAGTVELRGFNPAGNVTVNGGATAFITSGTYGTHGGTGTYVISGSETVDAPTVFPTFKNEVKASECYEYWRTDLSESKIGYSQVDCYTRYIPATDTTSVPGTVRYTVALFQPVIVSLSNNYVYYKNSTQFSPTSLVITTNGNYADLVRKTDDGSVFKCLRIGNTVHDQYAGSGSTVYYTCAPDNNGKAVITINSNGIKKWFASSGTKNVSVLFITGETNTSSITVGSTVKTGDESNIALWAGIMVASLVIVGCGAYIIIRKSRKKS